VTARLLGRGISSERALAAAHGVNKHRTITTRGIVAAPLPRCNNDARRYKSARWPRRALTQHHAAACVHAAGGAAAQHGVAALSRVSANNIRTGRTWRRVRRAGGRERMSAA